MATKAKAALASAVDEKKGEGYGSVTFEGVEYPIVRKPNTLLLSELARTSQGDPEALGVFAEFFEITLGEHYRAFKKAVYRSDIEDEKVLFEVLQEILEKTMGRPTE